MKPVTTRPQPQTWVVASQRPKKPDKGDKTFFFVLIPLLLVVVLISTFFSNNAAVPTPEAWPLQENSDITPPQLTLQPETTAVPRETTLTAFGKILKPDLNIPVEELAKNIEATIVTVTVPMMNGVSFEEATNEAVNRAQNLLTAPYNSSTKEELDQIVQENAGWLVNASIGEQTEGQQAADAVRKSTFGALLNAAKQYSQPENLGVISNLFNIAHALILSDGETTLFRQTLDESSDSIAQQIKAEQERVAAEEKANALATVQAEEKFNAQSTALAKADKPLEESQQTPAQNPGYLEIPTPVAVVENNNTLKPSGEESQQEIPDSNLPSQNGNPDVDELMQLPPLEQLAEPPEASKLGLFAGLPSEVASFQWSADTSLLALMRMWELLNTGLVNQEANHWLVLVRDEKHLFSDDVVNKLPALKPLLQYLVQIRTVVVRTDILLGATQLKRDNSACAEYLEKPSENYQGGSNYAASCADWIKTNFGDFYQEKADGKFTWYKKGLFDLRALLWSGKVTIIHAVWYGKSPLQPGMIVSTTTSPELIFGTNHK